MNYLKDPKDNLPSVSLTLLMVSFLAVLVAMGLNLANLTQSTGPVMELFYSCTALYFGRRLNVSGKTFSSDQAQTVANKLDGQ